MRRWYAASLLVLIALLGLAPPAHAQGAGAKGPRIGWNGWGVQVGVTSDPDQVFGGVHFNLGEFARDVRFRPTVDFGIGDDVTLLTATADVFYVFSKVQVWKPYVGGGVGFAFASLDNAPPGVDDSESDIALVGLGGVETKLKSGTKFFLELKIGLGDADTRSDFKAGAGWSWK
jgi:opacity protein-like surface antigen